jgi:hypothetical protein
MRFCARSGDPDSECAAACQSQRPPFLAKLWEMEDWLAFGRSVAGGLLTLAGALLTLVIAIALHYALSVLVGLLA